MLRLPATSRPRAIVMHPTHIGWMVALAMLSVLLLIPFTADAGKQHGSHRVRIDASDMEGKGFLGVNMQALTSEVREGLGIETAYGVLISGVIDDSPAAEAGLADGDVILKFNGRRVDSPDELRDLVRESAPGDKIEFEIARDHATQTIEVTLGDWGEFGMAWASPMWRDGGRAVVVDLMNRHALGVRASEVNGDLGSYFGVDAGQGVLVLQVEEGSVAEGAGVKAGDVILEVADEEIASVSDIRGVMSELDDGDEFTMTVMRDRKTVALTGEARVSANNFWFDGHFNRRALHGYGEPDPQIQQQLDDLRKQMEELRQRLDDES